MSEDLIPPHWPTPNYIDPELAGSLEGSLATSIILGTLTVATIGARLWARLGILHRGGLDDLFIVLALGFGIGFNVTHEIGIRRDGFGRHVWDIPFENYPELFLNGFLSTEFYLVSTGLIKISILLLYRRILCGAHGGLVIFNRINYGLMGVVVIYVVSLCLSMLFTCNPVEALWKQYDPTYAATNSFSCNNDLPTVLAAAYFSLFTDIAIAIFPLIFIRHVQIKRRERWALRALFLVCILACVAAMVRTIFITIMLKFQGDDRTYYGYYSYLWGTIEIYIAIICASAPALKPFFATYFSSSTTTDSSAPSSFAKKFTWPGSSRDASTANASSAKKERDTESDTGIELLTQSKAADAWDARSRLPIQSNNGSSARLSQPGGVLKRVDVEVKYLPEKAPAVSVAPADQV